MDLIVSMERAEISLRIIWEKNCSSDEGQPLCGGEGTYPSLDSRPIFPILSLLFAFCENSKQQIITMKNPYICHLPGISQLVSEKKSLATSGCERKNSARDFQEENGAAVYNFSSV